MPRLNRCYGHGFLHFITFSCYSRLRLLGTARRRDLFLQLLEQTRKSYRFVVAGYVAIPEHVHLLISEPERGDPGTVVQALKQRFARAILRKIRSRQVSLSCGSGCGERVGQPARLSAALKRSQIPQTSKIVNRAPPVFATRNGKRSRKIDVSKLTSKENGARLRREGSILGEGQLYLRGIKR